ncbi:hypothetical protein PVK06_018992 [Gossypium arboreum]|uniref:Uncharacterized protein n=1 Tax=Gossypium arboreum TaxID=29729 RepID=A0ABR0PIF7_GOSAR|nr:hypothetical protein PVK06_018992 [Gossypium arboreum]
MVDLPFIEIDFMFTKDLGLNHIPSPYLSLSLALAASTIFCASKKETDPPALQQKNISSSSKAATKMESPLFDFKDFSEINDFDFMYNCNDIMVNEVATNLSKGIEDIGSTNGSNNNQPVIDELNSNQILLAPANELHESPLSASKPTQMPKTSQQKDEGVELPPPLATTNAQTQLDPMNADLNTFGEAPLDQLIASLDLPNENFLHGWSSNLNLEQLVSLGFEGNNPSLKNDDDACQTTSPPFSPLIMERTNSFPLPLEEMLLKDGVYTAQPIYSEYRVNLVQTNQLNSHVGSSLPEDGVYTTQPVYSERRVNSIKANNLSSHIGSNLSKDGVYTTKLVYLERRDNSVQIDKLNGHVGSSLQDALLSSILQRLLQQEGLLNQPARLIPTYLPSGSGTGTGTSISSIVFNSLLQNETGGTSTSQQVGTPLSNYRKRKALRRQRPTSAKTRYGLGESSSSFKRFRRQPSTLPMPQRDPSTMSMPMPIQVPNAEHENRNIFLMHNETNTSSNASNLSGPRLAIKNSLYDPLFERIGLPVDPHLRMFATM